LGQTLAETWGQANNCTQHTEENCQDDQTLKNFSPIAHINSPYQTFES
jgi:hypothetical protein